MIYSIASQKEGQEEPAQASPLQPADVRNYPHLMKRTTIPAPVLPELPEVAEIPPLTRQSQATFPEFIDLDRAQ